MYPKPLKNDLVLTIRKRRFKWMGHILRMSEGRLVKLSTRVQHNQGLSSGNMFMDIPDDPCYNDICNLVSNRKIWRQMSCKLDNKVVILYYIHIYGAAPASPAQTPHTHRRTHHNPHKLTPVSVIISTTSPKSITSAVAAARYRTRTGHTRCIF